MSKVEDAPSIVLPAGGGLAEDVLGDFQIPADQSLYSFADALQQQNQDHSPQVPKRIETWVTFILAGEVYSLPVTHVHEILRITSITRVPHAPHGVRGLTNMRGKVLPVVDLRVCLGIDAIPLQVQSRVLVVTSRGRWIGLLVDAVQQVERIDRDAVQPPPADVMTAQSRYIIGVIQIASRLVILLDVDALLILRGSVAEPNLNQNQA